MLAPASLVLSLISGCAFAQPVRHAASEAAVREDFARVMKAAGLPPEAVRFERRPPKGRDETAVECRAGKTTLIVRAKDEEWGPAAYAGLNALGFLFPHPRRQITPSAARRAAACGRTYPWEPALPRRGFHLHTQHPSEFVAGFLEGKGTIAEDEVRWLARNGQNVLQVKLLRTVPDLAPLARAFTLARELGITTGVDVSFFSIQQKSARLGLRAARRASAWANAAGADYVSAELGTSEFTPIPRGLALRWMNEVSRSLRESGRMLFVKVHVSTGQSDPVVGNHNFLPRLADPGVGLLVHTVMLYALEDKAPVYGREDYADLLALAREERAKRPVWYFPETSYFIGIDIDVPLLLTGYLTGRAADARLLSREGFEGQVVFTTGQELAYWLMDWTAALQSCGRLSAYAGLDLLGEDRRVWAPILAWQDRWLKDEGLLSALSASNFMDELPFLRPEHRVLARKTIPELARDRAALGAQIALLERAVAALPKADGIKDEELRLLMEVTFARARHALLVRRALAGDRAKLQDAARERERALALMKTVVAKYSRYPEAGVFSRGKNSTSYAYGYGWPAASLWYWEREERIVAEDRRSPFFMTLYEPLRILF